MHKMFNGPSHDKCLDPACLRGPHPPCPGDELPLDGRVPYLVEDEHVGDEGEVKADGTEGGEGKREGRGKQRDVCVCICVVGYVAVCGVSGRVCAGVKPSHSSGSTISSSTASITTTTAAATTTESK